MTESTEQNTVGQRFIWEPLQPIPAITVELMPEKKWLKVSHPNINKYFTLAEAQAIHQFMSETCATDCDCWTRGYHYGRGEGEQAGNVRERA